LEPLAADLFDDDIDLVSWLHSDLKSMVKPYVSRGLSLQDALSIEEEPDVLCLELRYKGKGTFWRAQ
jgi:hypothetical protein